MGKKDFRLALSLWAVLGMAAVFMAARAAALHPVCRMCRWMIISRGYIAAKWS